MVTSLHPPAGLRRAHVLAVGLAVLALAASSLSLAPKAHAVDVDNHWRGHYAYIYWDWSETKSLARGNGVHFGWWVPMGGTFTTAIVEMGVRGWAAYAWYRGRCLGATVTYDGWPPNGWFWTYPC